METSVGKIMNYFILVVKGREKHPVRQIVNVREITYGRSWLTGGVLARGKYTLWARLLRRGQTSLWEILLT